MSTAGVCSTRVGARRVDEPDPVTRRHRPGVPARPARGPARCGAGRGPPVPGGAIRRPGRAPVAPPDLDRAARRGVRLEPVVHPAAAHAARSFQLRDRDSLGAGVYQSVPQRRFRPGAAIATKCILADRLRWFTTGTARHTRDYPHQRRSRPDSDGRRAACLALSTLRHRGLAGCYKVGGERNPRGLTTTQIRVGSCSPPVGPCILLPGGGSSACWECQRPTFRGPRIGPPGGPR